MRKLLILSVILVVGAALVTSVTQIEPGERAGVRRFGRILHDKPGPGLHVFLPFGMDRVDRVKINQVREVTVGFPLAENEEDRTTPPGQLLTGDHNLINVQVKLYYSVREDPAEEIEKFIVNAERIDDLVARAAQNALADCAPAPPIPH